MQRIKRAFNGNERKKYLLLASGTGALGTSFMLYSLLRFDSSSDGFSRENKMRNNDNIVLCDSSLQKAFNSGGNYSKHEYIPTHSIRCRDGTFVVWVSFDRQMLFALLLLHYPKWYFYWWKRSKSETTFNYIPTEISLIIKLLYTDS